MIPTLDLVNLREAAGYQIQRFGVGVARLCTATSVALSWLREITGFLKAIFHEICTL